MASYPSPPPSRPPPSPAHGGGGGGPHGAGARGPSAGGAGPHGGGSGPQWRKPQAPRRAAIIKCPTMTQQQYMQQAQPQVVYQQTLTRQSIGNL